MRGRLYVYDKETQRMVEVVRRPANVHSDELEVKILPHNEQGFLLGVVGNKPSDPRSPKTMARVLDLADREAERHPRRDCIRYQSCFDRMREDL